MESSYWLKLAVFGTLFAVVLTKEAKDEKDDKDTSDQWMSYMNPAMMPPMSFYRFPVNVADHQNFAHAEDEDVEPPLVRSIQAPKSHNKHFKDASPYRREVLLWPRPCGWEWDGNMYRWGPCNIFFGGPGFPW